MLESPDLARSAGPTRSPQQAISLEQSEFFGMDKRDQTLNFIELLL